MSPASRGLLVFGLGFTVAAGLAELRGYPPLIPSEVHRALRLVPQLALDAATFLVGVTAGSLAAGSASSRWLRESLLVCLGASVVSACWVVAVVLLGRAQPTNGHLVVTAVYASAIVAASVLVGSLARRAASNRRAA